MRPANSDSQRKHREQTSKSMKWNAAARRCSECGRGAAIRKVALPEGLLKICRYCAYVAIFPFQ